MMHRSEIWMQAYCAALAGGRFPSDAQAVADTSLSIFDLKFIRTDHGYVEREEQDVCQCTVCVEQRRKTL